LPSEWQEGDVQGLRARDGYDVGISWSKGRATHATIRAHATRRCRVQVQGNASVTANGRRVRVVRLRPDVIEFEAAAGRLYDLAISPTR
jgi:alpha-L-fucosidase 2